MENKKLTFLISHIFEAAEPIFYEQKPADIACTTSSKRKNIWVLLTDALSVKLSIRQ
jgi:hypothetical protein